jgi:hypothetical protein
MMKATSEVRDSCIQILDNFLVAASIENPKVLEDTTFIAYSTVASVIIATKLHTSRCYLSADNFKCYDPEMILFFERQIVMKTGSRMSTLASPTFFALYVISLCPKSVDQDQLLQMVQTIIGEFWEGNKTQFHRIFLFFLIFVLLLLVIFFRRGFTLICSFDHRNLRRSGVSFPLKSKL